MQKGKNNTVGAGLATIGVNLRSKTNAGKVFSYVYLLLKNSPSSPNPFSHRGEKGEPNSLTPLSRATKLRH